MIVVYFPEAATGRLKPETLKSGERTTTWFDPRTGPSQSGTLEPPDNKNDWVLVVRTSI